MYEKEGSLISKVRQKNKPSAVAKDSEKLLAQNGFFRSESNTFEKLMSMQTSGKFRHFWIVIYPSEAWVKAHCSECEYDGSAGWGTAPDDWKEQMELQGYRFCVSPLHWLDVNPDGTIKKPHWHVIVSWDNPTTYESACKRLQSLVHCPRPIALVNPYGAYRYHNHLDNPEKYQYTEKSERINGWTIPLDEDRIEEVENELYRLILEEDCEEYTEILAVAKSLGGDYYSVCKKHFVYISKLCDCYRHAPIRTLRKYAWSCTNKEEREHFYHLASVKQKEIDERKESEKYESKN